MIRSPLKKLYSAADPDKSAYFILFAFIVKMAYVMLTIRHAEGYAIKTPVMQLGGDGTEFLNSAINLKMTGFYYPDGKAPFYSFIIYIFLVLFGRLELALSALAIVQVIVSAVSVYILAKTAYLIGGSKRVFMLVFAFYSLSYYVTQYDRQILADSFTVSGLIFFFYFFALSLQRRGYKNLVYAAICLLFAIFLRPAVIGVAGAIAAFYALDALHQKTFKKNLARISVLLLPLVLFALFWGNRNRQLYGRFDPFMRFRYYEEIEHYSRDYWPQLYDFGQVWGGDIVYWDPSSELRWFGYLNRIPTDSNMKLPAYIYTSQYNLDSLLVLRKQMRLYEQDQSRQALMLEVRHKLERYTQSFKEEKPVLYRLLPLKRAAKFVLNNGGNSYNRLFDERFNELPIYKKAAKLAMVALFYLFALGGVFIAMFHGLMALLKRRYLQGHALVFCMSVSILLNIFVVSYIYEFCEYRYFAPIYPFCILLLFTVLSRPGIRESQERKLH